MSTIPDNKPAPKPQNNNKEYREHRKKVLKTKAEIYKLEQSNRKYLYAYEYKPGWWRLGGVSALKYYYDLARINNHKNVRKNSDNDHTNRWATGHITFNSYDNMIERLHDAGITTKRKLSDLSLRFTLPHLMTDEDVQRLFALERHNQEAANRMIMPQNNYPQIYTNLREISKTLTETLRKLDATKRLLYGGQAAQLFEQAKINFIRMANGQYNKTKFFKNLLEKIDYTTAWLLATNDYQVFNNQRNLLKTAEKLLQTKELCEQALQKTAKQQGSKNV